MSKQLLPTKFVTPEIVCSFPNLFEVSEYDGKYSLSIPISKQDQESINQINQYVKNAVINKWGEKALAKIGKGIEVHIRDAAEKYEDDDPVYAGTKFFNAKSSNRPGIVDSELQPIMDREEVYAGCIIRASVNFYGYEYQGKKGVAAGLQNVMKVRDGEPLGSKSNAADDFGAFAGSGSSSNASQSESFGNVF